MGPVTIHVFHEIMKSTASAHSRMSSDAKPNFRYIHVDLYTCEGFKSRDMCTTTYRLYQVVLGGTFVRTEQNRTEHVCTLLHFSVQPTTSYTPTYQHTALSIRYRYGSTKLVDNAVVGEYTAAVCGSKTLVV